MPKASQSNVGAKAKPTKAHTIIKLLHRPKGATLAELSKATGWQNHSVRGFLSSTVRKRMQLNLTGETSNDGRRRYRIVAAPVKNS